jgi:pSer/pThr/pTyr-binding forkhead associated (FHA) protein
LKRNDLLSDFAAPIHGGLNYQMGMSLNRLLDQPALPGAELEIVKAPGSLKGRRIPIAESLLAGRTPWCSLVLPDEQISAQHLRVFRAKTGGRYWVEDLKSTNGTYLNGKRVRRAVLNDGAVLQAGSIEMVVRLVGQR